jgi:hypothetical protein
LCPKLLRVLAAAPIQPHQLEHHSTAAWPIAAGAQQAAMPVVGYLDFYAAEPTGISMTAFGISYFLSSYEQSAQNKLRLR